MKKKLLLVVPLPPPMHGSNLINTYVTECRPLYHQYDVKVLPLHYAESISDIGSFRLNKLYLLFCYIIRLLKELKIFRPEAVYFVPAVYGVSFYRDCIFAAILKSFKVKVIYHLHGKGIKEKIVSPRLLRIYRWFFKRSYIIHLSSILFDDIKDVASIRQCRFLANGIKMPSKTLTSKTHAISDIPSFLYLSNLVPAKGPMILLEACTLLKNKRLQFEVYFVGNPSIEISEKTFHQKIIQLGLGNQVSYLGPKYGKDKDEIIQQSDFFVLPTSKDCFPLAIIEAMAAGLPVISTREGAIPEIIEEGITGLTVEKQNPEDLAEKMNYFISHPDQAVKMGQAGQKKFQRTYTLHQFHQKLIAIFDEILR